MTRHSTNDLTPLQHELYEERFYGIPSDHVPRAVIHAFLFSVAILAIVAIRFAFSVNSLSETEFDELSVSIAAATVQLNPDEMLTKEYWLQEKTETRVFVSNFVPKSVITQGLCPDYQPLDSYLVAAFPPVEVPLVTINQFQSTDPITTTKSVSQKQSAVVAPKRTQASEFISPRRQAAALQSAGSWQASRRLTSGLTMAQPRDVVAVGGAPTGAGSSFGLAPSGRSTLSGPTAVAQSSPSTGGSSTNAGGSFGNSGAGISNASTQGIRQSISSTVQTATSPVGSLFDSVAGAASGSAAQLVGNAHPTPITDPTPIANPTPIVFESAATIQQPTIASSNLPSSSTELTTFDGNDRGQLAEAIDVILDDFHLDGSQFEVPTGTELVFENQLSGTGVFSGGGDVTNNGELSPGNSPGIIGFGGSLTFGSTSNTVLEIAGTSASSPVEYDQINVGGDLTISSGATLEVVLLDSFSLTDGLTFNVITVGGTTSGMFDGLPEGALVNSYVTNFSGSDLFITYTSPASLGNNIVLYTTPIPEPLTTFTFAAAMGMLVCPRRRKQ